MKVSYEDRLATDFGFRRRCDRGNNVVLSVRTGRSTGQVLISEILNCRIVPSLNQLSTLGSDIDGPVHPIGTTYNTQDRVDTITSYADALGTIVASQFARQYNGLMQMTREFQSHAGAVDMALTPSVG